MINNSTYTAVSNMGNMDEHTKQLVICPMYHSSGGVSQLLVSLVFGDRKRQSETTFKLVLGQQCQC